MKNYNQSTKVVLALEKDAKNNKSGMQMRVWFVNNNTTVIIRLFKHDTDAHKKLWKGRNNGQVTDFMLIELYVNNVIQSADNWYYDTALSNQMQEQDEFEEKSNCIYFAWNVKDQLLHF
jgi:hypothetical protein